MRKRILNVSSVVKSGYFVVVSLIVESAGLIQNVNRVFSNDKWGLVLNQGYFME